MARPARSTRWSSRRYDVRAGGSWRYIHRDADGNEFGFHGVFHGEPSPDGFTQTFEFEGAPGHVALDHLTLEEHDGRTTVRTHSVYQSLEARDAMVANGMAEGMNEGYRPARRRSSAVSSPAPVA